MVERTTFHVWLHGLPTEHIQALRDVRKGNANRKQEAIVAIMPREYTQQALSPDVWQLSTATTEKKEHADGNQG